HGEDLEAAAAAPYHAVEGDPREHEAPGRRRCSRACLLWTLGLLAGVTVLLLLLVSTPASTRPATPTATLPLRGKLLDRRFDAYSVRLAGYEGIDPGRPAAVVSPEFRLTLRTANGACVDRAAVTVLYSGVALGWARVEPRDCAARRWRRELEVVARGQGVGLSERLRCRMASEWRSSGALELDVTVKAFDEFTSPDHAERHVPDRLILCTVTSRMDGKGSDSSACHWFNLLG
uniref:Late embryogenesis abundant protein LEA-2 subgroup domain-containing protein n=1 Tax=Oryza brachyantha TaxID=4533 RepID=J3L4I6_ORYBR